MGVENLSGQQLGKYQLKKLLARGQASAKSPPSGSGGDRDTTGEYV